MIQIKGQQGVRISNIHFKTTNDQKIKMISIVSSIKGFRIDHCWFEGQPSPGTFQLNVEMFLSDKDEQPTGVIDNNLMHDCRFLLTGSNSKYISRFADTKVFPGSSKTVFFEDNIVDWPLTARKTPYTHTDAGSGNSMVVRYNELKNGYLLFHHPRADRADKDMHRGARYWEIYGNVLKRINYPISGPTMRPRSGTGVIFGNAVDLACSDCKQYKVTEVVFDIEERAGGARNGLSPNDGNWGGNWPAGYPFRDQVGFATDEFAWLKGGNVPKQRREPAYLWDQKNIHGAYTRNFWDDPKYIARNREWYDDGNGGVRKGTWTNRPATCSDNQGYWATDKGGDWNKLNSTSNDGALYVCKSNTWEFYYKPYTYPHPLRSGEQVSTNVKDGSVPGKVPEVWLTD